MELRAKILRVMLWSLGLAAVTGVLSVFVRSGGFMGRVIWTELTAAVVCALILPCISMLERERTRAAGITGITVILLEFLLAIAMIWEIVAFFGGGIYERELILTMVIVGLGSVIAVRLLPVIHEGANIAAGWAGIATTATSAVVLLIAAWSSSSSRISQQCAETGFATLATGTLVSICLLAFGAVPRRSWRWVGIAAAAAALLMWLWGVWVFRGSELGTIIFSTLLAIAATLSYWIIVLHCPLRATHQWFRTAMMGAAMLTAALVDALVIEEQVNLSGFHGDTLERCAAASGIVTACGTLAFAVLARMQRSVNYEQKADAFEDVTIVCPRCQKKQSLHLPDGTCTRCSLRISIRLEEPRCPQCDYVLYGSTSDRCPECGESIGETTAIEPSPPLAEL